MLLAQSGAFYCYDHKAVSSVIYRLLFIMCTALTLSFTLISLFLDHHLHAHDTQLFYSFNPHSNLDIRQLFSAR